MSAITSAIRQSIRPSIRSSFGGTPDQLQALITSLFSAGEQGAFYIPRPVVNGTQALFQDAAGAVAVTADGDPVGLMIDQSGNGNSAAQSTSAARPTYNTSPDRLSLDKVDDALIVTVPAGGWTGTMVLATDQGTASYGVSIDAGAYDLGGEYFPGDAIVAALFRDGAMTTKEKAYVESYFVGSGATESYREVTNFGFAWYGNSLTSFPLIDTSSGTDFGAAWRGNSLTSFPLIDTSSGTNFGAAWYGNSLTSFPLIDTSSGTNFGYAWRYNSLTSFPLIDTSSGTDFGFAWYGNSLTSFPLIDTSSGTDFGSAWSGNSLTSFPLIDTSSGTDFVAAWYGNSLTSFPLIDTSSGTNFRYAWRDNSLTSFPLIDTGSGANFGYAWRDNRLTSFPLIDTSSGTNFGAAWYNNSLTSFPLIDTSSGTNFGQAWYNNSLTSFPLIDTSSGTNFEQAWRGNSLTSFPLIDTSSGTKFWYAWYGNAELVDFPANFFDNIKVGNLERAFVATNLNEASIDGILVSLVTSGIAAGTRVFDQSGGSAPSAATGQPAIDTLRSRGWAVTVTGGY